MGKPWISEALTHRLPTLADLAPTNSTAPITSFFRLIFGLEDTEAAFSNDT